MISRNKGARDFKPPPIPGFPVHSVNLQIFVKCSQLRRIFYHACRHSDLNLPPVPQGQRVFMHSVARTVQLESSIQTGRPHSFDGGLHLDFRVLQTVEKTVEIDKRRKTRRKTTSNRARALNLRTATSLHKNSQPVTLRHAHHEVRGGVGCSAQQS